MTSAIVTNGARRLGAVIGGLVGDAATTSGHWVYNVAALDELKDRTKSDLAFNAENICPYYKVELGDHTLYGSQSQVTAEYILEASGSQGLPDKQPELSIAAYTERFRAFFLDEKRFGPFPAPAWARGEPPLPYGWRSKSLKEFLAGDELTDDQPDGIARSLPLVALLPTPTTPEELDALLSNVDRFVAVTQTAEKARTAAAFVAVVLVRVLNGDSIADGIAQALERFESKFPEAESAEIRKLLQPESLSIGHREYVAAHGAGCALPGSLFGALHSALKFSTDYQQAIEQTITAGGDSASRACIVGALVGAANGIEHVPAAWQARTHSVQSLSQAGLVSRL